MFAKFLSMDEKKRNRIINAAIKVFAQKGYQLASTNEIVREAEISKGLLFHYFTNKKELYLFLYDHLTEIFSEEIYTKMNWADKDLFNRYRQVAIIKLELFQLYPAMFQFLRSVFTEDNLEVKGELEKRQKKLLESSNQKLFTDIDYSLFREGIDINKAMNIIYWTLEGFGTKQQNNEKLLSLDVSELEKVIEEMDHYMAILRQSFYKI
jgi:TetR/AcrR family transcriptional regulator